MSKKLSTYMTLAVILCSICMAVDFGMHAFVKGNTTTTTATDTATATTATTGHCIVFSDRVHTYIDSKEVDYITFQDSVGVKADGVIGTKTIHAALEKNNPSKYGEHYE